MVLTAECQATAVHACSMGRSYVGLLTDAPHWLFEITLEVLTAIPVALVGRWYGRREHRRIDAEHGVAHDG